jgi:hypothetical protein
MPRELNNSAEPLKSRKFLAIVYQGVSNGVYLDGKRGAARERGY